MESVSLPCLPYERRTFIDLFGCLPVPQSSNARTNNTGPIIVHVISLPNVSLPCINDVSHPILCDISPLVQHKAVCD